MKDSSGRPSGDTRSLRWILVLIAVAAAIGWILNASGSRMILPFPPLFASLHPHVGPGTIPAVVLAGAGMAYGPRLAVRSPWRPLLGLAWAGCFGWTASLALVDGWSRGWVDRLTTPDEYLSQLNRVGRIGDFLHHFASHIIDYRPGSWTTHVSSHPPLATLVFWALDHVGLSGGGWAGLLVILVGSSTPVAVAVTLARLGAGRAARRVLPVLVFLPAAVWVGVSADGLFAGVAAWSVAMTVLGLSGAGPTRGPRSVFGVVQAAVGGLLFGATIYLSYGLITFGAVLAAAAAMIGLRCGRVPVAGLAIAAAGMASVVVLFTLSGFSWWQGLTQLRIRYYQGVATFRPYWYFVWADLAALAICVGPAAATGLTRAWPAVRRLLAAVLPGRGAPGGQWLRPDVLAPAVLSLAAAAGVLIADLSGLSKAETERIWLPFAYWLAIGAALAPARFRQRALIVGAGTALVVNHLTLTNW